MPVYDINAAGSSVNLCGGIYDITVAGSGAQIGSAYDVTVGGVGARVYQRTPPYLFNNGDPCTSVTGGWRALTGVALSHDPDGYCWYPTSTGVAGVEPSLLRSTTGGAPQQYNGACCITNGLVDFSNISRVTASVSVSAASMPYTGFTFGLVTSVGAPLTRTGVVVHRYYPASNFTSTANRFNVTHSVAEYSGKYYVAVGLFTSDSHAMSQAIWSISCT